MCLETLITCAHCFGAPGFDKEFNLKALLCESFVNLFHMCLLRNCIINEDTINNMICYVTDEIRTPSRYSDIERGAFLPIGFEKLCFTRHKKPSGEIGLMIEIEFDIRFIQLRDQKYIQPTLVAQEDEVLDWELQELEKGVIIPSEIDLFFS